MAFIWHISVIQFPDITTVSGTLLRHPVKFKTETLNSINNAIANTESYFRKPYDHKTILIQLGKLSQEVKTDAHGGFSATFNQLVRGEVILYTEDSKVISGQQAYPEIFTFKDVDTLVISDIDDTIMHSFTRTKIKRFTTTLFRPFHKRKMVEVTKKLYGTFSKTKTSFYYVSKSELNLIPLISNFILHNDLPIGPLFLTPYLNFHQLIKGKKDASFKYLTICHILDHAPKKSVILIGDDTQADISVYTQIVEKYGSQIDKVYIHQTRRKTTKAEKNLRNKLNKTGVEALYFKFDDLF